MSSPDRRPMLGGHAGEPTVIYDVRGRVVATLSTDSVRDHNPHNTFYHILFHISYISPTLYHLFSCISFYNGSIPPRFLYK